MAQIKNIYKKCEPCEGTGTRVEEKLNPDQTHTKVTTTCPKCNGAGKYLWGTVDMA